jgi:two-component system nitrate/nitrite response regulator NarL
VRAGERSSTEDSSPPEPVDNGKPPRAPTAHELLRARRNLATGRPEVRGRALAVDDSDVFLRAAASVISHTSMLRLVGAVASGEEAIRLLPQLQPDLVLVDLNMPGMDGIQTTRIIRRDEPRTVVIVISAELDGLSDVALAAGAAATLDKREVVPGTLDALWLEHMPDGR